MVVLRKRCHQERYLMPAVPMSGAITLAAVLLLLILALHTLLASPVFDVDDRRHDNLLLQKPPLHNRRYKSSATLCDGIDRFVPFWELLERWEQRAKGLWTSHLSKNFHGCSNGSIEFAILMILHVGKLCLSRT